MSFVIRERLYLYLVLVHEERVVPPLTITVVLQTSYIVVVLYCTGSGVLVTGDG